MSVLLADDRLGFDPIGSESIAPFDWFLQTGQRTCIQLISWLSCQLHYRLPSVSVRDSGRIRSRTKSVPAGLFMHLNKHSRTPSSLTDGSGVTANLSIVTERIAE